VVCESGGGGEVKERQGMEGGKEGGRESKGRVGGRGKGGMEINSDVGPMSLMRCQVHPQDYKTLP